MLHYFQMWSTYSLCTFHINFGLLSYELVIYCYLLYLRVWVDVHRLSSLGEQVAGRVN